jgi:ankyrin repeat protein
MPKKPKAAAPSDDERQNRYKQREFLSAVYSDLPRALALLTHDPNCIHYRSSVGETAFHYLIIESQLERAKVLFEWGADINTRDDFGATPLIHAVTVGPLEVVQWLIENGASLEFKDSIGSTALSAATRDGKRSAEIFQFLISRPRANAIDYYYDDTVAEDVFQNTTLAMRQQLIDLGLTRRRDPEDSD